jgi:thioredoxin reductase (NADPH)
MVYDVIIIGGGPAGLTAAIYASRSRLKTLLIEKQGCGGLMAITDMLENYPGFDSGINGFELAAKMEKQARSFGTEIIYTTANSIEYGKIKKIITDESEYETKTIIISAGVSFKKLGIKGEEQFIGSGVSFCAVCDAPFYRNKEVLVVGGGNSALQEAMYLSKFAKSVKIIHRRSEFKSSKILQEKLESFHNISVIYDSKIEEIVGTDKLEKAVITKLKTQSVSEIFVEGIFVFIGFTPNTSNFSFLALDDKGYIITDKNMETSVPGIFACGDICKKQLRQVVTATADGAVAAASALKHIDM